MTYQNYKPACTVAEALMRDYRDSMVAPRDEKTRAPRLESAGRVPAIAMPRAVRS